jgi:hypothetical protein
MDSLFSFPVGLFHPLVGSRTGAVPLGFADLLLPVSLWECPNSATVAVSNPRLIKPSVRISRTGLSCLLLVQAMRQLQTGSAFATDVPRFTR